MTAKHQSLTPAILLLMTTNSVFAGTGAASTGYVQDQLAVARAVIKQYTRDSLAESVSYTVGDNAQGGVVFWVDESRRHGLVAALEDIEGPLISPQLSSAFTPPALGGIGSGYINTAIIMSVLSTLGTTPRGALAYTTVARDVTGLITNYTGQDNSSACNGDPSLSANTACYNGWYVPSRGEMQLMVAGLCNVDASTIRDYTALLTDQYYWSSNINYYNADASAVTYTRTGTIPNASCTGTSTGYRVKETLPVRPVRQF